VFDFIDDRDLFLYKSLKSLSVETGTICTNLTVTPDLPALLVRAVSLSDFEHDGAAGQGGDVCSAVRSRTRGAVAIPGHPRYQPHQQRGGAGASLRGDVAQADPRDL
jgi:hypothetical protein